MEIFAKDPAEIREVQSSLGLMYIANPEEYLRVMARIYAIIVVPGICDPGAIACTWGKLPPGVMGMNLLPSSRPTWMNTVSIGHEADHVDLVDGRRVWVGHTCSDAYCSIESERRADGIYQLDELREQIYRDAWEGLVAAETRRLVGQDGGLSVLGKIAIDAGVVAGSFAVGYGLGALLDETFGSGRRRAA